MIHCFLYWVCFMCWSLVPIHTLQAFKNCHDLYISVSYMMTAAYPSVRFSWRFSLRVSVTRTISSLLLLLGCNSAQQSFFFFPQNHSGDKHSFFFCICFCFHLWNSILFHLWNSILFGLCGWSVFSSKKLILFLWNLNENINIYLSGF